MALPFFTKPSPPPAPIFRAGQRQALNKPAQQKTSTFGYLLGKPSIGQGWAKKPIIEKKPGFLEKGKFRTHDQLITEVKKPSYYKSIPTLGKKFGQTERIKLIKDLEKAGGGQGGLSERRLGLAIKKFEKEKMMAAYHRDFRKVKELDQKIKQAKVWNKDW